MRAALCLLVLCCLSESGGLVAGGLDVAVRRVDITPSEPQRLGGYAARRTPSEGVDSPLHARIAVLGDAGGVLTALVSVETRTMSSWLRERVCGAIRGRTGIYRYRIAFVSTGTMGAPELRGTRDGLEEWTDDQRVARERWSNTVAGRVAEAVRECAGALRPASLEIVGGEAPGALVARVDGAPALVLFRAEGASAITPGENRVSSDRFGAAAAELERLVPGCVAVPLRAPGPDEVAGAGDPGGAELARSIARSIKSGPRASLGGTIDAQFEYVDVPFAGGARKFAVQVWRLDGVAFAFLPGSSSERLVTMLRRDSKERPLWPVARSNDDPGPLSADAEDLLAQRLRGLLESSSTELRSRVKPPPALEPREALKTLRVRPGFGVELAACEPAVVDPVAICFDEHGRLYACEMRDYPAGPGEGEPFDGRVRRLEDRDGDGFFEHSSIFAAELAYPCGIVPWRGGVFVSAATEVVFLADRDGDGRAEERRPIFTGFRMGNSQHLLNTLALGIDNRVWANAGDGGEVRTPGRPHAPALRLSHTNFRFRPDTLEIEASTGYRGGYGIAFDAFGRRIAVSSTNHAQQVMLDWHHLIRNRSLSIGSVFHTVTPDQTVHPASKPLERFNDPMDVGRFSSACGVHVYGGDRMATSYRGSLFACEPVSNLVHRDVVDGSGVAIRGRPDDPASEFLASTDHWFRPVQCVTGPDGALWVVDMYREVIEHPEWIPEHVQRVFDLRSGMDRGRIYRVTQTRVERDGSSGALGDAGAPELVEALADANRWRRETAQRLLVERGDASVVPALRSLLRERARAAAARRRALWTLEGLEALGTRDLLAALADRDPSVRVQALKVVDEGGRLAGPRQLVARVLDLASDSDPRVRFHASLALGAVRGMPVEAALARAAMAAGGDAWAELAALSSTREPVELLRRLLAASGGEPPDHLPLLVARVAKLIGDRRRDGETFTALDMLAATGESSAPSAIGALLRALPAGHVATLIASDPDRTRARRLSERLAALFRGIVERAESAGGDDDRVRAVELIGAFGTPETVPLLARFLAPRQPAGVQIAAVRALARGLGSTGGAIAKRLIEDFALRTPHVRDEILGALLADRASHARVLDAVAAGAIDATALSLQRRKLLLESDAPALRERARKLLAELAPSPDRARVLAEYREAIAELDSAGRSPDAARGADLFTRNCGTCHRFRGAGHVVGPDLESVRSRSRDALLIDVLDPNRSISPEFVSYLVRTRRGEIFNGRLLSETPSSIHIRQAEGRTDAVLRRDLLELRATGQSVMPEGLEKELSPADVMDILDYVVGGG